MTLDRIAECLTDNNISFRRNKNSIVLKTPFPCYIVLNEEACETIGGGQVAYIVSDEKRLSWFMDCCGKKIRPELYLP
jgi:hypothetical protein